VLILLEEINATMKQLARYWEKIRESGDPKVSPAVDAIDRAAEVLSPWSAPCPGAVCWPGVLDPAQQLSPLGRAAAGLWRGLSRGN
jgi:hypothetical protein